MHSDIDVDQIILVDSNNKAIGFAPKLASHHGATPLHRAFSCFIFNSAGQLLVTRRATTKKVFPGIWTNSCCGHPQPHEETTQAVIRRTNQELGLTIQPQLILPNFRYQARYRGIVENEICPVYVARSDDEPQLNPEEVHSYRWMGWSEFLADIARRPWRYSLWSRKEAVLLQNTPQLIEFLGGQETRLA